MQKQNAKSLKYHKIQLSKFGLPVTATGCTRNEVSHHEKNQAAMSYSSQLLTKQKHIQMWQLQYLLGIYEWMPNDAVQSSMSEKYWINVHS